MSSNASVSTGGSTPNVQPLRDRRLTVATIVALLPVLGTSLVMMALFFTVGLSPLPNTPTLVYGVANVVVIAGLYWLLPAATRASVFRYERPTRAELAVSVVLAVVAVGVAPLVLWLTSVFGFDGGPSVATFDSSLGALVVAVGAVLIAPVAEEVLFRGLLFGTLLARYDALVAVVGSSLLFGLMHVFLSGVPGVVEALLVGMGFAVVRYRYDNLAGVGVSHALINAYYVVAGIGLLPSLVPR